MRKILVVGDNCKDVYVYGRCDRICPEAPVPVFVPESEDENPGMAGNVAANLSVFPDVEVTLISNKKLIEKRRLVDLNTRQIVLRLDSGEPVTESIDFKSIDVGSFDAVIISDYDKGFVTNEDIFKISRANSKTFLDTKKYVHRKYCQHVKFIKLNGQEYEKNEHLLGSWSKDKIILTDGSKGAYYKSKQYPVIDVPVKDMTGAGDTFIAGLCYHYLNVWDIADAIKFANECASQGVQENGVSVLDYSLALKLTL